MLNLEQFAKLLEKHNDRLRCRVAEFSLAGLPFRFNSEPSIMGVINLSPDSWYRESVCLTAESAIERGRVLKAQGAALVDIGAESTLAHAARVPGKLQQNKLLPVIEGLCRERILVSVETYDASVARVCLKAGAHVLNLTGLRAANAVYRIVAEHLAAVIICYVQGPHVRKVKDFKINADPMALMHEYFAREIERANKCGVEKILIDPGLGFYYRNLEDSALRVRHQMNVFLNSFRLRTLGFPVCQALPHAFEFFREEVRSAEPFFAVLAALGKTDLFRTHEVSRVKAVLDTLKAY